jgi:hypothetical protein
MVTYESPNGTWAPRGEFVVTAQLPKRDGEFEYRIRSAIEQHDRMVRAAIAVDAPAGKGKRS